MTSEQARQLFDAALDDELDPETKREFYQALAEDRMLESEFSALRDVVKGAALLQATTPSVDLLGSVQEKLRARSGGRFYRDRFAEKQGRSPLLLWIAGGSLLLLLVAAVWLSFEAGLVTR